MHLRFLLSLCIQQVKCQVTCLILKIEKLVVGAFLVSGVWHVVWWSLITSVRSIQVGNNRNDHFKYFLGVRVRLIEVSA